MKMNNKTQLISRRRFLQTLGAGATALTLGGGLWLPQSAFSKDEQTWRFCVIADTHIIDEYYTGDEDQIYTSNKRLGMVRDTINAIEPAVEKVFIAGDFVHNYPSSDWEFYQENRTRFDIAKELADGFNMPVHVGLGNHDYDIPDISREFTHELVKLKFGIDPYYTVEHRGWKFIHVNNFLGDTMNPASAIYNRDLGSLGETQLNWLESELEAGLPTIIFLHYPLVLMKTGEVADLDLLSLLRKYRDTIKMVWTGHLHMWLEFADMFGPLHYSAASTRYDKNTYLIFEVNGLTDTYKALNWSTIHWGSNNSDPWEEAVR